MKKLEIWRRRTRDGAAAEPMAAGAGDAVEAVAPATAEAPAPAIDDEVQRLRQAAMLQHEDTVPAAFYRAHAD